MAKKNGNGEGSITKRKDGNWMGRVTVGRTPDGQPKRVTFYGKTRAEVHDKITKALNEIKTGTFVEPNKMTLSEWLDIWLIDYKKANLRPNTYTSYEQNIRVHIKPKLGHYLLKDLRGDHLQKFYNEKLNDGKADGSEGGLSPATIKKISNILHEALDQAVKNQLVPRNVTEMTTLPRLKKKDIKFFTLEEQDRFMDAIVGDKLEIAFVLALSTGMRIGEILALSWKDVDLKEGVIRVTQSLNRIKIHDPKSKKKTELCFQETKTKSGRRTIPLPENVLMELKAYKLKQQHEQSNVISLFSDNDLVVCTELGNPVEPRNLMRSFYRIIKAAKIPRTNFHSLRHTFATRALEVGIPPKVVQEMLGHSTIVMTLDTYSHVIPDMKKDAAAKINNLFERKNSSIKEAK